MENENLSAQPSASTAAQPVPAVPAPNELEIIAGRRAAMAHFIDGPPEPVQVRIMTVREWPKYSTFLNDEPGRLELICGKEKGWADRLTMESHEELIAIGEELNADPFVRWLSRLAKNGRNAISVVEGAGFSLSDVQRLASFAG